MRKKYQSIFKISSRREGFTLIEVLLALSIFTLIAISVEKFFHSTLRAITAMERLSNYRFNCARLFQFLGDDLHHGTVKGGEIKKIGTDAYIWPLRGTISGSEDPMQCVYARDAHGTIHRIILNSKGSFDPSQFAQNTAIASSFASFSMGLRPSDGKISAAVEVAVADENGKNLHRALFPAED
ncbi:MAG: prepilin-type N-terminal cleavage/methylation domain-containing protein [Puniceicoccales bacterium]|nr:prepilin-type N-terminal cleavage/methylation domain-containing protein [Puniceicoccales bacterium]